MKEYRIGWHLREDDLGELLMYVVKWFNWLNTMYRVTKHGDHFDLYWTMTPSQYKRLCADYRRDLDAGLV